jgi:hypothetical protein
LKGGGETEDFSGRVVPTYEAKNNPDIPREEKQINQQKMGEIFEAKQKVDNDMAKNQLLNLQLYQPPPPKKTFDQSKPMINYLPSVGQGPYLLPFLPGTYEQLPTQPIINYNKVINIEPTGPTDNHGIVNMVYEDAMTFKNLKNAYNTLGDRNTQTKYIKSVLFPEGNGDTISFSSGGVKSILSHVKFMELNPYNSYRFSNNPYKGMPDGFLIYKSCYPIQRDTNGVIVCARNAVTVNIRIYKLTVESSEITKQDKKKFSDFSQWREVGYYEYIREHILKKKLCPHFVGMYGYYVSDKSGIDFDRITAIKLRKLQKPQTYNVKLGVDAYQQKQLDEAKKMTQIFNQYLQPNIQTMASMTSGMGVLSNLGTFQTNPSNVNGKNVIKNPDEYEGNVLAILTESPTYSLYNWASKLYKIKGNGNTKVMVGSGVHSENVWMSIIFQIMFTLLTFQIHEIFIDDFSLEKNVYIKSLNEQANVSTFWKYKINNLEYYIPNYGYIVMIDSNFSDIDDAQPAQFIDQSGNPINPVTTPPPKKFKLDGKIYNTTLSNIEIKKKCFEMFKAALNPDNFTGDFINFGGVKPDEDVMSMLDKLYSDINATINATEPDFDIQNYITKYMRRFMNNRIGTFLKETEYVNVRKDDTINMKPGQIVVRDEGVGNNKFVLYLGLVPTLTGTALILTKNDPSEIETIQMNVPITSLYNYSRYETIQQNYNVEDGNITEESILETYNLVF